MLYSLNISEFNALSLVDKFSFFEVDVKDLITSHESKEINFFFKAIILNDSENSNIRKQALKIYIECVFLEKIKARQALALLMDDWNDSSDVFLNLQRLKELYLFYNEEKDIEQIYIDYLRTDETEIVSEAYIFLGLIYMQKGFSAISREETFNYLNKSKGYFISSNENIENRIDSQIYSITIEVIIDSLQNFQESASNNLKNIATLLFGREVFTFRELDTPLYLGFYRILNSIYLINQNNSDNWLDYRKGFNQLYVQYAEINNQALKERLNHSVMSSIFIETTKKKFIEPYFALNFQAQTSKIESRLTELNENSEEYKFLTYIKSLANNQNYKKKAETDSIRDALTKFFPQRSIASIDESLAKIKNDKSPFYLLNVVSELQSPNINDFIDKLIYSCIKLQGNRLYRGKFSEDDRNTFISNLLETSGYNIKDQTRWSKSDAGKSAGEIDIFVSDIKKLPFTIIEALNLDSLNTKYTILHIDKIFKYDATGLENNFILVYSSSKDFIEFWKRYIEFISKHNYQYEFLIFEELNCYSYTDIKIGKAKHIRNDKEIYLYHLMVDLSARSP